MSSFTGHALQQVMCRGIYTAITITAGNFRDSKVAHEKLINLCCVAFLLKSSVTDFLPQSFPKYSTTTQVTVALQ